MTGIEFKEKRNKLGLNQTELAKELFVSKRTIINYEKSETVPEDKVKLLLLLVDESEKKDDFMFVTLPNINEGSEVKWTSYDRFKLVPLVQKRAQAGFLSGWGDDEYIEELPKVPWEVDREYKGNYLTFEVSGESMESDTNPRESLYDGDMLLCREVQQHHWQNKLHIHKWDFIIVHKDEGILCKRIIAHDVDKGIITLRSLNPMYEDFQMKLKNIIAIFNIIDVKRSRRR